MSSTPTRSERVVAIGGGHGLAMLLRAVRTYAGSVTAVVATGDDGGSSGRIRSSIPMPAPGDLRRCLTEVATDRQLAESLDHRFTTGELAGHAVGNLLLAGLVDSGHDLADAADHLSTWLGIDPGRMRVLPSTYGPVDLVAETPDGPVRGQVAVEAAGELLRLGVDPADPPVPEAATDAIAGADQIVLAPGSFYTSVLGAAVVPGIRRAIEARRGRLVFVCNLRADETGVKGFDVARHVAVLAEHGLAPDVVVAQEGALAIGAIEGPELFVADVDRPHGLAHDAHLLGAVLGGL